MPLIPEETIVAVREATDLVALVSEYVRDLKASGQHYKGLSPFNSEKTPSFFVHPARQSYKCYSSGEGGNCFTFLMKMENITFPEAVRQLAERSGIEVPTLSPDDQVESGRIDRLYQVNAWAKEWFVEQLHTPAGETARQYLQGRSLSQEVSETFGIGWSPDSWESLRQAGHQAGYDDDTLGDAGLLVVKAEEGKIYDRFRARVMFPIHDARGRVVGFGGRVLGDDAVKYVNSPESPIFVKSRQLYGLSQAARALRRDRHAVLAEGYTDVIMAHQHGLDHVLAALGTSLNEDHAKHLKRWVDRVTLVLDGDDAGKRAAWRSLPALYAADLEVRLVFLPDGLDPCETLTRHGGVVFSQQLDHAKDPVDLAFETLGPDPSPDDVSRAVGTLTNLVSQMPSAVRRELFLNRISELSGLRRETVEAATTEVPEPIRRRVVPVSAETGGDTGPSDAEKAVLAALIARPALAQKALEMLGHAEIRDRRVRAMVARIISYLEDHPEASADHVEAMFQDPDEMELAVNCRAEAPEEEAERLLSDGFRRLIQARIVRLESTSRQAREAGDRDAQREAERLRYDLTRALKARPTPNPTA